MKNSHSPTDSLNNARYARPDFRRDERKGVPEVILTNSKTIEQSLSIARSFVDRTGRAILSRVSPELHHALVEEFGSEILEWYESSNCAILRTSDAPAATGGRVGILSAGTSDQPIAEEAAVVCQEMGCTVHTGYDVGVAGLHRLFGPLDAFRDEYQVDVIIVAAGMDGALPSVVSGLVEIPVIGLPTSVGYGMGGKGEAALLSMLQTCAPGMAVVNIDNGVGAGAMAGLIANRAAAARNSAE